LGSVRVYMADVRKERSIRRGTMQGAASPDP
jgi:hypothetical protein